MGRRRSLEILDSKLDDPAGAEALSAAIDAFLAAPEGGTINPRSRTAEGTVGPLRVHLKHGREGLGAEPEALAIAERAGSVGGVRAPRLVGFDAARNVLVTEHLEGENLFNHVWNRTSALAPWRRPEGLAARIEALAGWLRAFHREAERARPEARDVSAETCARWLAESTREALERMGATGRSPLGAAERAALAERIEAAAADPAWAGLERGLVHGDFTHVNILVAADGSLRVLDFADARPGFLLEDLARLWCGLWEIARCGPRRRRALGALLAALPGYYGLPGEVLESTPFRALRLWNAVSRLDELASGLRGAGLSTRIIHRRIGGQSLGWLRREVLGR